MKKLFIYLSMLLWFATQTAKAQVLFSEDFDSYSSGHLISDYTSTIPDQGGWFTGSSITPTASIMVTPETGKGNVVVITSNGAVSAAVTFRQAYGTIDVLWNNRTAGNNIFKFEFEFYGASGGNFNTNGSINSQATNLINVALQSNQNRIRGNYFDSTSQKNIIFRSNGTDISVPLDTWTQVEMYIDYNTSNVYFYLPALNILETHSFSHNRIPEDLNFYASQLDPSAVVKYDNIKLSALQTLPSHLVSVSKFVSSKFSVFPNPITDVVTITSSENIGIEQIEVFDISGKIVKTLNYNNENEVQLNMADFTSGMYLLHIKTNEGTAVKKVVKK